MATTDTIFPLSAQGNVPTDTVYATLDTITDAAAAGPKSITVVLRFDGATTQYAEWRQQVPSHYDGGGFTWSYKGGTDGTATAAVQMDLAIKKIADGTALDSDLNMDGQTVAAVDDAQPATDFSLEYSSTQTLSHANAGSPAVGDYVIIRLSRDTADSNTDDMLISKVLILEA